MSDANAVRNLVTHGFAARPGRRGGARVERRRRHGDGDRRSGLRAPARGGGSRAPWTRRRSTRACGGCSRRSCGWACSTSRTSTRIARREVLGDPGAPGGGPHRRRAVGGAAAQRGRPAAARRRQPRLDRRDRPAGRLPARHAGAVVLRLRPRRDRDRAGRHPEPGSARRRVEYAPGVRPAQRVFASMFDMFGGNAPEDPEGFDDEAELQRAVDAGPRRRRRGGGGRRVAEHDRRGGVALVAGAAGPASSSCCRPSSRPARRSCCW